MALIKHMLEERGRASSDQAVGIVDIGSNSVRLVVYSSATRAVNLAYNEKVPCGLGRTLATTGKLDPAGKKRALNALVRFRAVADRYKVGSLIAVATAAVRDAGDGKDFIAEAQAVSGIQIDVLSGEREAEAAARGVMMGFVDPNGVVADLGGGSLELVDVHGHDLAHAVTLPVGALRLMDAAKGKIDKASALVDEHLDRIAWLGNSKQRSLFAVGGTWRALAKLHMAETAYPLPVTQGYVMSFDDALGYAQTLRKTKKIAGLPGIEDIARARREHLPFGALVLERLLLRLRPKRIVYSVFGVREGLLYDALSRTERNKDPLLAFCENFARSRSRSVAYARELCVWTDKIFETPGPTETIEERRLRHAACLISDIGSDATWPWHPDFQEDQALSTVAYSGLSGIDHPGRIFLALSIYYGHAGSATSVPEHLSAQLRNRLSRRAHKRAKIIGAAIRAADVLGLGKPGIIPSTPITYQDDKIVLSLPGEHAQLDGERLRRRFKNLAALLGGELNVQVE